MLDPPRPMQRSLLIWRGMAGALLLLLATSAPGQDLLGLAGGDKAPEAPTKQIDKTSSPAEDRALDQRLQEIYAQVEGLAGVEVQVSAGVVQLSGEVLSGAAREKALTIANQLQGVVEVQSEIREARDVQKRLQPMFESLRDRALELVGNLPLFLVSLVVFALFLLTGRLAARGDALYRRLSRNEFARDLLRQAVRAFFFVAGAVVALEILDATAVVAAFAGVAGLAGLAVSFAFRDLAENYIASVLLSLRQPFLANENVVIDGNEGHVVRLTSRATILLNPDGNHVRIPNSAVFKATIVNYSRNPRRRFGFQVGVASETDLAAALALGVETLRDTAGVLDDPAPQAVIEALADWSVTIEVFGWIDQREADYKKVRGEAMRRLKEAYDAAGIAMPEPIVNLRRPGDAIPESAPADVAVDAAEVDVSPDTQIEEAIAEDRAAAGDDLLDDERPVE